MHPYIPLTDRDERKMLAEIGVSSIADLFNSIPAGLQLQDLLELPAGKSEPELLAYFKEIAAKNHSSNDWPSFRGAGSYRHFVPSISEPLIGRGEFLTSYTPYQPELAQGTLQAIFEFQTMICQLTGMEVANASLYDGASAAAESALMALRLQRKRNKILVSQGLHPEYRQVLETHLNDLDVKLTTVGLQANLQTDVAALQSQMDDSTAAVLYQSPNFFGSVEDQHSIGQACRNSGVFQVASVTEALSLGLLQPPGAFGADIVSGEGQSLGIPQFFGGPTFGFFACREKFVRNLPGRLAGETVDAQGKRGFVLTLSTREQHIRRAKATSNICTNQGLIALMGTIYMSLAGKQGLREAALQNFHKAQYAADSIRQRTGLEIINGKSFFNEFTVELPKPVAGLNQRLRGHSIVGPVDCRERFAIEGNLALFCVTECNTRSQIDQLVDHIDAYLQDP